MLSLSLSLTLSLHVLFLFFSLLLNSLPLLLTHFLFISPSSSSPLSSLSYFLLSFLSLPPQLIAKHVPESERCFSQLDVRSRFTWLHLVLYAYRLLHEASLAFLVQFPYIPKSGGCIFGGWISLNDVLFVLFLFFSHSLPFSLYPFPSVSPFSVSSFSPLSFSLSHPQPPPVPDRTGKKPIHVAALVGAEDVVVFLLEEHSKAKGRLSRLGERERKFESD